MKLPAKFKRKPIIIDQLPMKAKVKPLVIKFSQRPMECPSGYELFKMELGYYHYDQRVEWHAVRNDHVSTWLKNLNR